MLQFRTKNSVFKESIFNLLKKIQNDFVNISCNKKGTYALQGILDIVNLKEEEVIINESIKNDVLKLSLVFNNK